MEARHSGEQAGEHASGPAAATRERFEALVVAVELRYEPRVVRQHPRTHALQLDHQLGVTVTQLAHGGAQHLEYGCPTAHGPQELRENHGHACAQAGISGGEIERLL